MKRAGAKAVAVSGTEVLATQPAFPIPEPLLRFDFGEPELPGLTLSADPKKDRGASIKDAIVRWLDEQL